MKINRVTQFTTTESLSDEYDLFIAVSGYESRSTYVALLNPNATTKAVFGFNEGADNARRIENDNFYKTGYEHINCSVDNGDPIVNYLKKYIESSSKKELTILVDYSSMPRVLYSAIIRYLKDVGFIEKRIKVSYIYSKAQYVPPPDCENSNYFFDPIPGFNSLSIPSNPTALIVGLGYERRRASGLKEYFDAEETYLFYTAQRGAEKFHPLILERNKELLDQVKVDNIFEYPIDDLLYTRKILYDICSTVKDEYRVVLAPCGPKPFTLIGLIVASEFDGVDVWRISGESGHDGVDRVPDGKLVILSVEYC